jgi:hypothetical protein
MTGPGAGRGSSPHRVADARKGAPGALRAAELAADLHEALRAQKGAFYFASPWIAAGYDHRDRLTAAVAQLLREWKIR